MVAGQGGPLDGGCGPHRVWILPWRAEEPSSSSVSTTSREWSALSHPRSVTKPSPGNGT